MATPANNLDIYVSYTYHFELHCTDDWDEIKNIAISNLSTTRFASAGTLMINTRTDAHQTIDNVSLECVAPASSVGDMPSGLTDLKFVVKEPGGFSFIEKIKKRMYELDISEIGQAIFGLKIIFVGRKENNDVDVKELQIIPLSLVYMAGNFSQDGGHYQLDFTCLTNMATVRPGPVGQHLNYAFINRNIVFSANTIEEAFAALEKNLNENYLQVYSKELSNSNGSKTLVYKIDFDSEIKGLIAGVAKESFAPDANKTFSFGPNQSITKALRDIIDRCPELAKKIGPTSKALKNELHNGVFVPIVTAGIYPKPKTVEVHFNISIYKGGGSKFEFDYFFSDPGKNVDIANYNLVFNNVSALLATNQTTGADTGSNFSGQLVFDQRYMNLIHEPVTQTKQKVRKIERSDIDKPSGNVAYHPISPNQDGHSSLPYTAVAPIRLSSNAFADFNATIEPEQIINIRGHYQILELCITSPDKIDNTKLSAGGGIWAKVNIFMLDEGSPTGKRQFFYTGYYQVTVIVSNFSEGKFTQTIRMVMNQGFTDFEAQTQSNGDKQKRLEHEASLPQRMIMMAGEKQAKPVTK